MAVGNQNPQLVGHTIPSSFCVMDRDAAGKGLTSILSLEKCKYIPICWKLIWSSSNFPERFPGVLNSIRRGRASRTFQQYNFQLNSNFLLTAKFCIEHGGGADTEDNARLQNTHKNTGIVSGPDWRRSILLSTKICSSCQKFRRPRPCFVRLNVNFTNKVKMFWARPGECEAVCRYKESRQYDQKFPLYGYFHLNQTSSPPPIARLT